MTIKDFRVEYGHMIDLGSTLEEVVGIRGRTWSIRTAGSKLVFLDISQDQTTVQGMIDLGRLSASQTSAADLKQFVKALSRGDIISIQGRPHRTSRNELSIAATELPTILSPCVQPLPELITSEETKIKNRHVDLLINRKSSDLIRLRSHVVDHLRNFLNERQFVEAQTPILASDAGGAIARPFSTRASELPDRELALRVAPELWLKRLIMGGFEKVFELGPSFRNEGIDLTHNPEFWTCEFYQTYADLDELISMTETLLRTLKERTDKAIGTDLPSLDVLNHQFVGPYPRVDFINTIEVGLGVKLPDLSASDAHERVMKLCSDRNIPLPKHASLPRFLDKLSSEYVEPRCIEPTWIVNIPECLSPLSKSFTHPQNGQQVAARAELFVDCRELVNTYEEENSPIEQRRKFEMQAAFKDPDNARTDIDESYLQALEYGMPPTGGWGCGIDRLCMLFGNTNRIADVLSFGTLRNVVALGSRRKNVIEDKPEA